MMTQAQFLAQANKALASHTVYGTGAFGASIGNFKSQLDRYYDNTKARCGTKYADKLAEEAKTKPCFAFDCVGLPKGILWNWNAVASSIYGGADYESNGVPDAGAGTGGLISYCKDVSTDFSTIIPGELLWIDGHVGIYIGNGEAIECTTAWKDGVQKTVVTNVRQVKSGEYGRKWTKHGKLPWVQYNITPVTYSVVIGGYNTKAEAEKMQAALKVLGTNSTITEK